jgi:hypothetical protein
VQDGAEILNEATYERVELCRVDRHLDPSLRRA